MVTIAPHVCPVIDVIVSLQGVVVNPLPREVVGDPDDADAFDAQVSGGVKEDLTVRAGRRRNNRIQAIDIVEFSPVPLSESKLDTSSPADVDALLARAGQGVGTPGGASGSRARMVSPGTVFRSPLAWTEGKDAPVVVKRVDELLTPDGHRMGLRSATSVCEEEGEVGVL